MNSDRYKHLIRLTLGPFSSSQKLSKFVPNFFLFLTNKHTNRRGKKPPLFLTEAIIWFSLNAVCCFWTRYLRSFELQRDPREWTWRQSGVAVSPSCSCLLMKPPYMLVLTARCCCSRRPVGPLAISFRWRADTLAIPWIKTSPPEAGLHLGGWTYPMSNAGPVIVNVE